MKRAAPAQSFNLSVEFAREDDGRWIADIPALPGVTVYGRARKRALASAQALALRVIADRLEHGEAVPFAAWRIEGQCCSHTGSR
jgi:predicted RNase H-like HicB family nuclease